MTTGEGTGPGDRQFILVLRLVLLLAIVSAVAVSITWFDVLSLPGEFDARFIVLAVIIQVASWLLSAYSWQRVVLISTGSRLPFRECFAQNALLLAGKYIPGKIWGLVARIHQLRRFEIHTKPAIHASYLEQLSSLHVGLVFGVCAWLVALKHEWQWPVLVMGLASLFVLPLCHAGILRLVFDITPASWREKMKIYSVIRVRVADYLYISLLYLFEWVLGGIIAVCVYMIMSGSLPSFQFTLLLSGSNAISMVTGFVAFFAPAGIGVRELVNARLLLDTLSLSEIAGLVLLMRCWSVVSDISLGGVVLIQQQGRHPR